MGEPTQAEGSPTHNVPQPCANCGAPLSGRYCAACGQRAVEDRDFSVIRLSRDWLAATFSLDSRGLVTLRRLLFAPGRLSVDYMAGRRSATYSPFQIFVLVSLVFFLLPDNYDIVKVPARWFFGEFMDLTNAKMESLELSYAELSILYDNRVGTNSKLGLITIIGALALVSWIIGFGQVKEFGKHFVATLHNVCFVMTMFLLMIPLIVLINVLLPIDLPRRGIEAFSAMLVLIYITLSQRCVLRVGMMRSIYHGILLFVALVASIYFYRIGISWLTLWSL